MSWIPRITPESASAELRPVYERIQAESSSGRISHVWQVWGGDREGLATGFASYRALFANPAPLTPAQAEMIAVVVSATNGCGYSVAHHGPRVARLVGEELARAVALDYREANLPARDRVVLDAAVALTCEPAERKLEDIERLREYGFDDLAILKATEIAAWFNLVNRMVLALGIELEPGVPAWEYGSPT